MASFRHRYATRLNSFRGAPDLISAIRLVAAVPGIAAVELNHPEHIDQTTPGTLFDEIRNLGLEISALNLRYDPHRFKHGAFTNPDPVLRAESVALTCEAVDFAASRQIPHVILWMGPDGFDYPFQVDYQRLWQLEIQGFRDVVAMRPEIRVSVEYKPSDPRRFSLIRSMGESIVAVHDVGAPNFGVTLDVCHSLMAGEVPAAAASLALREEKLFGIHLNDGYGPADDGLMVGSVHFHQTLELLHVLRQHDFRETIYFDTFPDRVDPSAECAANIGEVERMERILDRVDTAELEAAQRKQDAVAVLNLIRTAHGE